MISTNSKTLEQQIIDIEKKLLEAVKKSDHQVLDELLHDKLVFTIPTGQIITKNMDLEAHRSGQMVVNSLSTSEQTVTVIDDATVVVSVKLKTDGKMMDQNISGEFRYIRVWKLFKGQWKIIAGSCTNIQ